MKIAVAACLCLLAAAPALAQSADRPADSQPPPRPDWITATNKPCKLWNPEPQPNESVTWSGACKDGYATGKGVVQWFEDGKADIRFDGTYMNGKRNGPGTIILPDGREIEGAWINDEPLQAKGGPI